MSKWQPIETAPKDGRPIWAKGCNFGDPENGEHCVWAWWDGDYWRDSSSITGSVLTYLHSWMPSPIP